jgi:hypothetical protein
MTDYGHSISFGLSLYRSVGRIGENRRLVQAADPTAVVVAGG